MSTKPRFYVTTAIDYPNGAPHMGHAYEKLITDAYARWYRWMGYDVHYLTGTDENGQKLAKTAKEKHQEVREFVDQQAEVFRKLCDDLKISHDDFIRTTEARHVQVAQKLWSQLKSKNEIYEGDYEGLYCLSCEAFYTELQAPEKKCPHHDLLLEEVKEKGFFFKLSKYAQWIEDFIEDNKSFIRPESARKELLKRIRQEEIRDISISRPNSGWGIPVPGHEDYVMYTWFDALINYLSGVLDDPDKEKFWPAQLHVIGKDIIWFHCVIWPCLLKASNWSLPEQVYVHGMVLGEDGRKMSKSLNNGVDPYEIIEKFPLDSFRYYLLRAIPSGLDGAFVREDLRKRHNNELANDFGNLLSRVVKLAIKRLGADLRTFDVVQELQFDSTVEEIHAFMEAREHHRALDKIWEKVHQTNLYLNQKEPWKIKDDQQALKQVLVNALYSIYAIAALLDAFLPQVSTRCLECLGVENKGPEGLAFDSLEFRLSSPEVLFPKID